MSTLLPFILVGAIFAVVGFVLARILRGVAGTSIPFRDPRLILPAIPLPHPGTEIVEVRATSRVTDGHAVRASVIGDGGPVTGVELHLIERNTGTVADSSTTDSHGVASFTAPSVQAVTNFEVEIASPGYAHYWGAEDPRTWDYNMGFYPEVNVTVVPVGFVPAVVNSPRVWVDVAGGWTMPTADMDELEGACGSAGYEFDEDWWVGDETMFDHARELGPDDIWILGGHGIDKDNDASTSESLAGWRPGALVIGYTDVAISDICAAFGDNGAPGIVFLDACSSHSLLDQLVECCVKMAVGWSGPVPARQSSASSAIFVQTLLGGGTVDEASAAANDQVNRSFSQTNARVVIRTKSWMGNVGGMSLTELQSATSSDDHWNQFDWEELTPGERAAWGVLGWTQEAWDEGGEAPTVGTPWEELTDEQRRAARSLGWTQESWDAE